MRNLRKQYVLINSDERTANSRSSTDFTVSLREPIQNVVKTDLVNLAMDYRLANVRSPDNQITINVHSTFRDDVGVSTVTLPEDQYSVPELVAALQEALGADHFSVVLINQTLRIEFLFPSTVLLFGALDPKATFSITCSSATLRRVLGLISTTTSGVFTSTIGGYGGMRLTFPRPVALNGVSPFIMIQSTALGVAVKTGAGLGFWRLVVNNAAENSLEVQNNRTDNYLEEPRRLQDIDNRYPLRLP
jgi:hypothetical protein